MTSATTGMHVRHLGDITIVEITERRLVDQAQLSRMGRRLNELIESLETAKVMIDFEQVESMSSAALGMLIEAHNTAEGKGGELHSANLEPQLRKMITMTKLHKVLNIHKTAKKALDRLT